LPINIKDIIKDIFKKPTCFNEYFMIIAVLFIILIPIHLITKNEYIIYIIVGLTALALVIFILNFIFGLIICIVEDIQRIIRKWKP